MDAFILIFKGLQQLGFHNHFVLAKKHATAAMATNDR